jgi:hypothetical protein
MDERLQSLQGQLDGLSASQSELQTEVREALNKLVQDEVSAEHLDQPTCGPASCTCHIGSILGLSAGCLDHFKSIHTL